MGAPLNLLIRSTKVKAIKIKFVPTSNKRPARLRADVCEGHSLTETYDYIDLDQQAFELAKKLIKKLEWKEFPLAIGSYKNDWYVTQICNV